MYCRNCGKEINDEAVICVHCGTVINSAAYNGLMVQPVPTVNNTDEKKNWFAIAGFILSFLGIISWLFSILGLVFSIVGLVKCKQFKNGKGFGISGIVISVCTAVIHYFMIKVLMAFFMLILLLLSLPGI